MDIKNGRKRPTRKTLKNDDFEAKRMAKTIFTWVRKRLFEDDKHTFPAFRLDGLSKNGHRKRRKQSNLYNINNKRFLEVVVGMSLAA